MLRILQSPRTAWCERPVDRVGLLVDGDDYYRAFYEACLTAERYILLSGWQFDTDAALLRGAEADESKLPVTLAKFLDALCERTESLRIYILAWDFHAVFSLEREWMQDLRFKWTTNDRIEFVFDGNHPEHASHHQKFAVVDGRISFVGGLDLCDHRWDDRRHEDPNPLRVSRGAPHKPFHDVQAYVVGSEVSAELTGLFRGRWDAASESPMALPSAPSPGPQRDNRLATPDSPSEGRPNFAPRSALEIAARRVALSRTTPSPSPSPSPTAQIQAGACREIGNLYVDAIARATALLYIETQYFSSWEIAAALIKRLAKDSAPLEVVIVLNMEAETLKEEVAVGLAQAKVISDIRDAAVGTRHQVGIFYTVPQTADGEPTRATYIHSKLMIVDDRFLTIGSANLTNRSISLDTELNVSVEAERPGDALEASIRQIRHSLLAEHIGSLHASVLSSTDLVARLNALAASREGRLRLHPSPTDTERALLATIDPQTLPFDPSANDLHDRDRSLFVGGLGALWTLISGGSRPSPS